MTAQTLAQLCSAIRENGELENAGTYTNAFLTRWVNQAIRDLVEIVSDQFAGYFDSTTTVATVAGTQTVNLPANFRDLRALDRQVAADRHAPLRRLTLGQTYAYQGRGAPRGYMLHGGTAPGTIRLFPVPDAVYTLRLTYEPVITPLALDADTFDFGNGWEDYVHQLVLLEIDLREERPVQERMVKIDRARQRIIGSAQKRNSAEPEYLVDWNGTPDPAEAELL